VVDRARVRHHFVFTCHSACWPGTQIPCCTRHSTTGSAPSFIHTSGTGVLIDNAGGDYSTETIYNDADPDQIETLAPTQVHRNVDLEIVKADEEGYAKTYIILPSTIYGIAQGKLVENGIQNPHSIQIPLIIRVSLDRGQGGMVGEGKNIWPNVHIEELADLYIALFNSIRTNPGTGHGRNGFYFGESDEHTLHQIAKAVSEALVKLGKGTNPEASTFTQEELNKYFQGSKFMGSNSRCRANRSRSIGWKPVRTTKDMLASVQPEVEALLRANQSTASLLSYFR